MTTNAQAALQAAATIYTGGPTANPIVRSGEVRELAERFKTWLDTADLLDEQDRKTRNHYDKPATAQGSSDRRGARNRPPQCQAIGASTVCYYNAGHDGAHSWQLHQ